MPATHELQVFANECQNIARALGSAALVKITNQVALDAKKEALTVARGVLGGDLAAHNFARGRRFNVGYDVVGPGHAVLHFRPPGGWILFDRGAGPHKIPRGRRRRNITINADVVRGPVVHPGTTGKKMFERSVRSIEQKAPESAERAFYGYVAGVF